ncbi:MAG: FAD-dependent oxidoreductase [Candidatus Dependentiae bacterium]|nr:FAD-dependent oxidoreductase [Candidatus Dependentiae bacterium]
MDKKFFLLALLLVGVSGIAASFGWFNRPKKGISVKINDFLKKDHSGKTYIPIAILGSGPAGASAAIYGARSNMTTVSFQGNRPGGLLTQTSEVENWPGLPRRQGPVIMQGVREQAEHFGAIFIDDTIDKVDLNQWPFMLHTEGGDTYYAFSLIVATGANPTLLDVPGEQEHFGMGVHTCATCDAAFYKGKEVFIVGGGDSAIEEAIQLASYAKKVTILVRKDKMRAAEAMQGMLKGYPTISVQYNTEVKKIIGDGKKVNAVELLDNKTNETKQVSIDGLFLAVGHQPNTTVFKGILAMDSNGYIILKNRNQHTSQPGVFAAGDCHDTEYRQAGTAAGYGIMAAKDAISFLQEEIGFNAEVQAALADRMFKQKVAEQSRVINLATEQEFQEQVLNSKLPVLIDFYADYCPTCMQMLPTYEIVAKEYADKMKFIKVNHETSELAQKLNVAKVPCLLVYYQGKQVAQLYKTMGRKELIEFIQKYIPNTDSEIAG